MNRSREFKVGPGVAIPLIFFPWLVGVVVILKATVEALF